MGVKLSDPYFIVFGNEKGGTGKSTISMHIMVQLLKSGFSVGSIDLDGRQGTLTRYVENRRSFISKQDSSIPVSTHYKIERSNIDSVQESKKEEKEKFIGCIDKLNNYDFIVIDTPGSDSYISRLAHSYADTLITPLNDSFIDVDLLVRIDKSAKSMKPSTYAEMVWDQKKNKLIRDKKKMDWIVVRNRLSTIFAKNKQEMHEVLQLLSERIGFRLANGFCERVIFRELFLYGLTLLDIDSIGKKLTLSHISARQELRNLMSMIEIPQLKEKLKNVS